MTLHISHEMLEAAYAYLRSSPPFKSWRLPDPDDVEFRVTRERDLYGWHQIGEDGQHIIAVSSVKVGHTSTLMETLAHEMCHAADGSKSDHGERFKKMAAQACRIHGFDPKSF